VLLLLLLLFCALTCAGTATAACTTWLQRPAVLNATRLLLTLAPAKDVACIFLACWYNYAERAASCF